MITAAQPVIMPMISKKESDNFTRIVVNNIPKIRAQWGQIMLAACSAYGVDPNIMIGFLAVESPDLDPNAVSSAGAIGLMQMQVATAFDYLCKQTPKMPAAYGVIVEKWMPGFLKPMGFNGFYSRWKAPLEDALYDAEFNIWTAVTGLSQMIWADLKTNKGKLRLDHVVIKYNAGGNDLAGNYHKFVVTPGLQSASPDALLPAIPLVETRAYLIKLLGIDGAIMTAIRSA
jgi:soluble lytic murein transglycosylase-like protein